MELLALSEVNCPVIIGTWNEQRKTFEVQHEQRNVELNGDLSLQYSGSCLRHSGLCGGLVTELTAGSARLNVRINKSAHFMVYAPVICRVRI